MYKEYIMKLQYSRQGYDFYIGTEYFKDAWDRTQARYLYNIVPVGSPVPETGYYNKKWIENVKGVYFN